VSGGEQKERPAKATGPLKMDNPLLVQWEYASEERLAVRSATYRALVEGTNAEEVLFAAVREAAPKRILDVGCGTGELAERIQQELRADVIALDISPRMVDLTRSRGVEAVLGDVQQLPFPDGEFDCVTAAWILYHVPDLEQGISELARVLRPGGTLVASTVGEGNLRELWELIGDRATSELTFGPANGKDALAREFSSVEAQEAAGTVVFPDRASMHRLVAATITRAHLADRVPEITEPFSARTSHVVFVARKV
jgi:SAM-dependent methyltransferase